LSMQSYDDEVVPVERTRPAEAVGGFLAAAAIAISAVAIVYRPVRLAPFALVIAFVAVGLTRERHARLAAAAVVVGAIGWVVGMTVAVLTGRPLY
jgi:cell division inhibitor SulA